MAKLKWQKSAKKAIVLARKNLSTPAYKSVSDGLPFLNLRLGATPGSAFKNELRKGGKRANLVLRKFD